MESPLPPYIENPNEAPPAPLIKSPSPERQNWGAVVSIIIIVLMIVVGAFYAWGQRIAEQRGLVQEESAGQ